MIVEIFSHLRRVDICHCRLVCRRWNRSIIINDNRLAKVTIGRAVFTKPHHSTLLILHLYKIDNSRSSSWKSIDIESTSQLTTWLRRIDIRRVTFEHLTITDQLFGSLIDIQFQPTTIIIDNVNWSQISVTIFNSFIIHCSSSLTGLHLKNMIALEHENIAETLLNQLQFEQIKMFTIEQSIINQQSIQFNIDDRLFDLIAKSRQKFFCLMQYCKLSTNGLCQFIEVIFVF
jgi:hypothetical protein